MSKVEIKLNSSGVRDLLKNGAIAGMCQSEAEAIASRAGDGYVVEPRSYPERSGYVVKTATFKAMRDNLKNNTLLKAMGK